MRTRNWIGITAGLALSLSSPLRAELATLTINPCDADTLLLTKSDGLWTANETYTVKVFRQVVPSVANPIGSPEELAQGTAQTPTGDLKVLRVDLPLRLPPGENFRVTVASPAAPLAVGDISTKAKGTLERSVLSTSLTSLDVASTTPLAAVPKGTPFQLVEIQRAQFQADINGNATKIPEQRQTVQVLSDGAIPAPNCDAPDDRLGFAVDLAPGEEFLAQDSKLELIGLQDIYGNTFSAEGELKPVAVPKERKDAAVFVKFLVEDAKGSKSALSIDLKAQPAFELRGAWLYQPELTAFVSKNVPKATNALRFASLFSRTERGTGIVETSTFSLGPALESDREFDRVNGVLDLRWKPGLRNSFISRTKMRDIAARKAGVEPDRVAPPDWGYGFDLWVGLEAGGSLSGQTVNNSDNTASLDIDRYDILRLRPFIHGFIEYKRITLDVSSTLRYLLTDELTWREDPTTHALSLVNIEDSRPLTDVTLSWAFDPSQHVSLAVSYKNGSEPPLFVEVEKYSVGLVAKY